MSEFEIKKLEKNDLLNFQLLIELFREVFEMNTSESADDLCLKGILEKPCFVAVVVMLEDEIVGGLTAYEMPLYYGNYSEIYIYDIAVKTSFHRMGVGKKMMGFLKEYCKQNGIREILVEAHEEDKHAIDFYKSIGGVGEKVMHFNISTGVS